MRSPREFAAVLRFRGSGRAGGRLVVVHVRTPDETADTLSSRVGFVVSKAVGNSVVRHRTQRRLRHLMRERLTAVPAGSLVVVRAQPAAADADGSDLARELDRLIPKALAGAR